MVHCGKSVFPQHANLFRFRFHEASFPQSGDTSLTFEASFFPCRATPACKNSSFSNSEKNCLVKNFFSGPVTTVSNRYDKQRLQCFNFNPRELDRLAICHQRYKHGSSSFAHYMNMEISPSSIKPLQRMHIFRNESQRISFISRNL